jgi:hypothetical protein
MTPDSERLPSLLHVVTERLRRVRIPVRVQATWPVMRMGSIEARTTDDGEAG